MNRFFSKIVIIALLSTVPIVSSQTPANLKIVALRVDFKTDDNVGTSGNGKFIYSVDSNPCRDYTIDPPPHDKSYFESQLKAVNNYYQAVSNGKFGIDLTNSDIFPNANESAYTLPDSIAYYHPFGNNLSESEKNALHEQRIVEFFTDALNMAYHTDDIDFSNYDLVIIFHAGTGNEIAFEIETTPEDIPTTFVDNQMIRNQLGTSAISIGNASITQGLIIPETLNNIYFSEFTDNLTADADTCLYQLGLTGTLALLIGQAIGMPPLWDVSTGKSGIGKFGLMDQGAFNGKGLIPAPPMAWNRIFMGWEASETVIPDQTIEKKSRPLGKTRRIDINDHEYFLIENRTNWFRSTVSIDSAVYAVRNRGDSFPDETAIIFDSLGAEIDDNGVIIAIPDYDLGLPGSGLLIWHIDEKIIADSISSYAINSNRNLRGIDLEEAGGAQDIGFESSAVFRTPEIGEIFDMWYQGNPEYDGFNADVNDRPLEFSSQTLPNTKSNHGAISNLRIYGIGFPSDTMHFSVSNDLILSGLPDTSLHILYYTKFQKNGTEILVGKNDKNLWWSSSDKINKKIFYNLPSEKNLFVLTNIENDKKLAVLSDIGSSLKLTWFKFDQDFKSVKDSIITDDWDSISYISGSIHSDAIQIIKNNEITLSNLKTGEIIKVSNSRDGGIIIGDQPVKYFERKIEYISAIDLDLDGKIEILAVDEIGDLHAFSQNYTQKNGFPRTVIAKAPVLAKNIIGDIKPEIIFQNRSGEIIILNSSGEIKFQLANYEGSSLRAISEFNGRNTIVTESSIWVFDEIEQCNGNQWTGYYHDELNSNTIEINYSGMNQNKSTLIDLDQTYVYPNPVKTGKAKIRVHNYSAEKVTLKIYDVAGYFVDEINADIDVQNSPWELDWDVNDYESGVYLIKLNATNGSSETEAILKVGIIN